MVILARQKLFDGLAIGASGLCLIHCLALPILILLIPALTAWLVLPEAFHTGALAFAVPTSVIALGAGYRRHRWLMPTVLALPGLFFLVAGVFAAPEAWVETLLTAAGSILLAMGHALNWRALPRAAVR